MGRKSHIRMRILDFKVIDQADKEGKPTGQQIGVISVEIRKGKYLFKKPYGVKRADIKNFDWDQFKLRVYTDAQKYLMDKEFEAAALRKIDDFIGVELMLD